MLKTKFKLTKNSNKKLILIKDKSIEIDGINLKIENEMTILENKSIEYIKLSKTALLYKLLLLNKSQYDKFVNIGRNRDNFLFIFTH